MRALPNIIITGTPGTGKTTLCESLLALSQSSSLNLKHLPLNDLIKSQSLHTGFSADHDSLIVDDDKLLDAVESQIADGEGEGGWVIDWHSTAGFAVRWVDLVVVLRCEDTAVLYDRLVARGYKEDKVQENMDAEIFGVVGEEARDGWDEDRGQVVDLKSERAEEVEENAEWVWNWVKQWVEERQKEGEGRGERRIEGSK